MVSDQTTIQQLRDRAVSRGETEYYNAAIKRLNKGKAAGSAGNPITRQYERMITFVSTGRFPREERVVGSVEAYNAIELQKDIREKEAAGVGARELIQQKKQAINDVAAQKMSTRTVYSKKEVLPPAPVVRRKMEKLSYKEYRKPEDIQPKPVPEKKSFIQMIQEKKQKDYAEKYGMSYAPTGVEYINQKVVKVPTGKIIKNQIGVYMSEYETKKVGGDKIEYIQKPLTEEQKKVQYNIFGDLNRGLGRTDVKSDKIGRNVDKVVKGALEVKQKVDKPLRKWVVEPLSWYGQIATGAKNIDELNKRIETTYIGLKRNVDRVSNLLESKGVSNKVVKTGLLPTRAVLGTGYFISKSGVSLAKDLYDNPSTYVASYALGGASSFGLKYIAAKGTAGLIAAKGIGYAGLGFAALDLGGNVISGTSGLKKIDTDKLANIAGKKIGQYSAFSLGAASGSSAYNYFQQRVTTITPTREVRKPTSTTYQDVTNKRSLYSIRGESAPPRVKVTTTRFRSQFGLSPLKQSYIPARSYNIYTPQWVDSSAKSFNVNLYRGGKSFTKINVQSPTAKLGTTNDGTDLYFSISKNQPILTYTQTGKPVSNINFQYKGSKPTFQQSTTAVKEVGSGGENIRLFESTTTTISSSRPIRQFRVNTPIQTVKGKIIQFAGQDINSNVGSLTTPRATPPPRASPTPTPISLAAESGVVSIIKPNVTPIPSPKISKTPITITYLQPPESIYSGTGMYEQSTSTRTVMRPKTGNLYNGLAVYSGTTTSGTSDIKTGVGSKSELGYLELKTKTKSGSMNILDNSSSNSSRLEVIPNIKTELDTVTDTITETKVKQNLKSKQELAQESLTKQKLKLDQLSVLKQSYRVKSLIKPPPTIKSGIFGITLPKNNLLTRLNKSIDNGTFNIYVREKGKDIKIGTKSTRSGAVSLLSKKLKSTLSASGYIKKGDKKLKYTELEILGSSFRPSKIDSFRVVQKKNKRLGSFGETSKLQYFRGTKKSKVNMFGL